MNDLKRIIEVYLVDKPSKLTITWMKNRIIKLEAVVKILAQENIAERVVEILLKP